MGSPTGTTLSRDTRGPDKYPSRNTSRSMIALSVSTVATTVPRSILSPTAFSQVTKVPSVMVSESLGILMALPAVEGAALGEVAAAGVGLTVAWAAAGAGFLEAVLVVAVLPCTWDASATSQAITSPTGTMLSTGVSGPER